MMSRAGDRRSPGAGRSGWMLRAIAALSVLAAALTFFRPVWAGAPWEDETGATVGLSLGCDNYRCGCGASCGCGVSCACGSPVSRAMEPGVYEFGAQQDVILKSRLSLAELGTAATGNDCWGYTSPSGREYALMGTSNALTVVEVTDPANPVILGSIPHQDSPWSDEKVFGHYAYVVNESGGGVQIVDLSAVDEGVVTLAATFNTTGINTNHNIAINEDSGFAYLCGSAGLGRGLVILDLTDPLAPFIAGTYPAVYVHDAEVVSYTEGPYAGREIAYCAVGATGLDIVDVTDKANVFRVSRRTYPGLRYCHQAWLDKDAQLLYVNDELDENQGTVATTTTRVFDVQDIAAPLLVGSFTTGLPSTDHNLYVKNGFIYEANYRSGLRIFDARGNPTQPEPVGWFDTYPIDDGRGFDGAWSVYPFFPSGTVILSDIQGGLFVFDTSFVEMGGAPLSFEIIGGVPDIVQPEGGIVDVSIEGVGGESLSTVTAPRMLVDRGEGFEAAPLEDQGDGVYRGQFPTLECGDVVRYYFEAEDGAGITVRNPLSAPLISHRAHVATLQLAPFADDFEIEQGWIIGAPGDDATTGVWERVAPNSTNAQPGVDNPQGLGTLCYVTENGQPGGPVSEADVDNGVTTLTSPLMDATGGDAFIKYARWYSNNRGASANIDSMPVLISNDDGASWTLIEDVNENLEAWVTKEFRVSDFVEPTNLMRVRFIARDLPPGSIVEAGVDDVRIIVRSCGALVGADLDGDGAVGAADLALMLGSWGPCVACPADLDGDGQVGASDLALLLGSWG